VHGISLSKARNLLVLGDGDLWIKDGDKKRKEEKDAVRKAF